MTKSLTTEEIFQRISELDSIDACARALQLEPISQWDESSFLAAHPDLERAYAQEQGRGKSPPPDIVRQARFLIGSPQGAQRVVVSEIRGGGLRAVVAEETTDMAAPELLEIPEAPAPAQDGALAAEEHPPEDGA